MANAQDGMVLGMVLLTAAEESPLSVSLPEMISSNDFLRTLSLSRIFFVHEIESSSPD